MKRARPSRRRSGRKSPTAEAPEKPSKKASPPDPRSEDRKLAGALFVAAGVALVLGFLGLGANLGPAIVVKGLSYLAIAAAGGFAAIGVRLMFGHTGDSA